MGGLRDEYLSFIYIEETGEFQFGIPGYASLELSFYPERRKALEEKLEKMLCALRQKEWPFEIKEVTGEEIAELRDYRSRQADLER
jgi:hypothetical protein